MEPTILDGALCLFTKPKGGTNQNKILVVNHSDITDSEFEGRYTIKRYFSEKEFFEDGTWKHKKIVLKSDNRYFKDIILQDVDPRDFIIVAEFLDIIN